MNTAGKQCPNRAAVNILNSTGSVKAVTLGMQVLLSSESVAGGTGRPQSDAFLGNSMSSRTFRWSAAMIAAMTLSAAVPAAKADFAMVSQSLTIDQHDHTADFSMTFNETPDFTTVDSYGRPEDSFQYNFSGMYVPSPFGSYYDLTAIVRGDEIHLGDGIRVRNPNGDGGPESGGWGPVVDNVPFHLIGKTISFSVPSAALGYGGGYYQYEVFSLNYGSATVDQTVTVIPLPSAFYSGLAGLLVVGVAGFWMRRKQALTAG